MPAKAKLEILFSRHSAAWHLRVQGWPAPYVQWDLNEYEAFRVREPDLKELEEFMPKLDAPFVKGKTAHGGVAIEGSGRSAVALWEWLDGYLIAA